MDNGMAAQLANSLVVERADLSATKKAVTKDADLENNLVLQMVELKVAQSAISMADKLVDSTDFRKEMWLVISLVEQ